MFPPPLFRNSRWSSHHSSRRTVCSLLTHKPMSGCSLYPQIDIATVGSACQSVGSCQGSRVLRGPNQDGSACEPRPAVLGNGDEQQPQTIAITNTRRQSCRADTPHDCERLVIDIISNPPSPDRSLCAGPRPGRIRAVQSAASFVRRLHAASSLGRFHCTRSDRLGSSGRRIILMIGRPTHTMRGYAPCRTIGTEVTG
jgi:hypothetical protein